jgi:hypothetical protein
LLIERTLMIARLYAARSILVHGGFLDKSRPIPAGEHESADLDGARTIEHIGARREGRAGGAHVVDEENPPPSNGLG